MMKPCLFILVFLIVAQLLTAQTPGSFYSLSYGGRSAHVAVKDDSTLNFTGELSIEAWIKPDSFKSGGISSLVVSKHDQKGGYDMRCNVNGRAVFRFGTANGWKFIVSKTKLKKGQWYHIAGTYNGDSLCIYVNGKLERVKYDTASLGTSYGVALKFAEYSRWGIGTTPGRNFDGQIDEIRIWNKALTTQEINAWMFRKLNNQHNSIAKLIGNWRFDEATGSTAYDQTSNANHGSISRANWKRSNAPIGDSFIVSTKNSLSYTSSQNSTLEINHMLPNTKRVVLYWVGEKPNDTTVSNALVFLNSEYYGIYSPDTIGFEYDFKLKYNKTTAATKECLLDAFFQDNIEDAEWRMGQTQFRPSKNQFIGKGVKVAELIIGKYYNNRKVDIRNSDTVLCNGQNARLSALGNDSFSYQWYKNGIKLPNDTFRVFRIDSAGTYKVEISRHHGCSYTSIPVNISVNKLPIVKLKKLNSVCVYDDTLVVKPGTPAGGFLSGPVIIKDSLIVPSLYSPGVYDVIYNFTDGNGCFNADTQSIRFQKKPNASFAQIQTVCNNNDTVHLKMGRPFGGNYYGAGVINNAFYLDSVNKKAGDYDIEYIFVDSVGCSDTSQGKITVLAATPIDFPSVGDTCANVGRIKLKSSPPTPNFKGSGVQSGFFYPSQVRAGIYELTCSFTNPWGCTTYDTSTVTVLKVDTVQFSLTDSICINSDSILLNNATPKGGNYQGEGVTNNHFFNPKRLTKFGKVPITYRYTNSNGCVDSDTTNIQVFDTIKLSIFGNSAVCENDIDFQLDDVLPKGGDYYINGLLDGVFSPASLGDGVHVIDYVLRSKSNCKSRIRYERAVYAMPKIEIDNSIISICQNSDSFKIENASPPGGNYYGLNSENGFINPKQQKLGTYAILYSFLDSNACSNTDSFEVEILESPKVKLDFDSLFCDNEEPIPLLGKGKPSGGNFFIDNKPTNSVKPRDLGLGSFQLKYQFSSQNACSDSAISSFIINNAPTKPELTKTDTSIISSSSTNNQWHNLNGILKGDTTNVIYPKEKGNYFTVVSNENCRTHSDTVLFIPLSFKHLYNFKISVYPNPASNILHIKGLSAGSEYLLSFTNVDGKALFRMPINSADKTIALPIGLQSGVYLLSIKGNDLNIVRRIEIR